VRSVSGPRGGDVSAAAEHVGLLSQQTWFSDAVTGPETAPDAARVLTPGPRLTPAERLQIYRDGYRARLVECLADDYAAVRYLLGEAAFEAIAHAYIDEHPSRSPNLNAFGRAMPAFLARRSGAAGPLALDVARLEWAIVEAIHAAASPPLTLDRFEHMTPEQWATAVLVPAASVRLLRFAHPADTFYTSFREGERPIPPAPAPSATLVHRRGWVVWRTALSPAMAGLLEAIISGVGLGAALTASIAGTDDGVDAEASPVTEANVTQWFREWVSGGVFTALELPEP
jgi:hypothetical protein